MRHATPLVLAATVSSEERLWLAKTLKEAGLDSRCVGDPDEADGEISAHRKGGRCVIVIDSGLLEMRHDGRWRALCGRPGLGVVVRRWMTGRRTSDGRGDAPLVVHPDDSEGLVRAVLLLAATAAGG